MHSHEIYYHLRFLDCGNFEQMLVNLHELRERINDSMEESVGKYANHHYGLAKVEETIVMVINAIEYAKSSDLSPRRYPLDFCSELRQAIRNSVFVNSRDIDR